jgi:hypothetical protein
MNPAAGMRVLNRLSSSAFHISDLKSKLKGVCGELMNKILSERGTLFASG